MWTSVGYSFLRSGRGTPVPAVSLFVFSAVKNFTKITSLAGGRRLLQHPSPSIFSRTPWQLNTFGGRSVSVSASFSGEADPADSSPALSDWESFGSLSTDISSRRTFRKTSPGLRDLEDREDFEGQEDQDRPQRRPGRRNTPYWYFLQCKKLIKENKLQEALDMFSRDMLEGERLQPEEYNYSVLIGGCGRAGQLKKAFKLYNDLKKRGLEASDATYTALFNACAESPRKPVGLQQALKLEQELRRKNYALSTVTYHALLKTHAVTNHLQACIHTLREMFQNGHIVTQETFHYLLMGCWKDKDMGFRLALQVWRQMLRSGILPDTQNYNLLLRTARDCGIGDPSVATVALLKTDSKSQKGRKTTSESRINEIDLDGLERQLFIEADQQRDGHQSSGHHGDKEKLPSIHHSTQLIPVGHTESMSLPVALAPDSTSPNLLDYFEGKWVGLISLGSVEGVSDRLALIGGVKGLLAKMEANGLSPDLRTLTLLADTMEPGYQSLQVLLKVAKQHKVKLDIAFFNSIIRRAARAGDMESARSVLNVMQQRHVKRNIQTFGCLALGCKNQQDGLQLLQDIKDAGLKPNVHVFSALIGRASQRLDYVYLKTLLKSMREMEVWPNEVIIKQLEFAAQYPPNYDKYKSRNSYLVHIDGFRGYYQHWLRVIPAQSTEEQQTEPQSKTDESEQKTDAEDRLTEAQRNQRAASRRYHPRNKDKTRSSVTAF
ncbi:pentatricopeptide repeat-containing protein 1, mitochondrial [Pholidichthys leucotaenia]